jgi:hypothetical protein
MYHGDTAKAELTLPDSAAQITVHNAIVCTLSKNVTHQETFMPGGPPQPVDQHAQLHS